MEFKKSAYACVCITNDGHGSVTVWDTAKEAWDDARERAENFRSENLGRTYWNEVYDGYKIFAMGNPMVKRY